MLWFDWAQARGSVCLFSKLETAGKNFSFPRAPARYPPIANMYYDILNSIVMRMDYESSKDIAAITAAKRMKLG